MFKNARANGKTTALILLAKLMNGVIAVGTYAEATRLHNEGILPSRVWLWRDILDCPCGKYQQTPSIILLDNAATFFNLVHEYIRRARRDGEEAVLAHFAAGGTAAEWRGNLKR